MTCVVLSTIASVNLFGKLTDISNLNDQLNDMERFLIRSENDQVM